MNTFGFDIPNPDDPFGLPPLPSELNKPPFKWERPVWPIRWRPARIRILVVTDGAYFSDTDENGNPVGFSLSIALRDAFDTNHPEHPSYARFEFTRATHANQYSNAYQPDNGYNGILLTADVLEEFDELWLFGVRTGAPYLNAAEVNSIESFMDAGGGVLAMGDHEDLGLGMCGQIKRVRSMRKWWFQSPPPPPGMQVAPHSTNLSRNDTVHAITPGGDVNLGQQDDATPQTIFPNYRYSSHWWRPFRYVKYPHPVLCGPRGAIRVMPDHQHEGDCIVPNTAFSGEYPGGVAVDIIATGRNVVGRTKAGFTITDPREFGLLGAWDGHDPAANVGRVLVDSTWHHWFNVNLYGLKSENGDEYKDILAFFRNVATWLAPQAQQTVMRRAGTLIFMFSASMIEHTLSLRDFRTESLYRLGVYARDALGRIAPQCQSAAWFIWWVERFMPKAMLKMAAERNIDKEIDMFEAVALDIAGATIFGGIINSVAVAMNERGFDEIECLEHELDEIVERGAKIGLEEATKRLLSVDCQLKSLLR